MADFRTIFEAYGGDYESTMERFLGNEAMYKRLLGMLFADENMAKLDQALRQGDLERAFEAAHTLKGVAGNMGLKPFYQSVCRIVEPLRAREKCDAYAQLYQTIKEEMQKVAQLYQLLGGDA